jgi:hypothetical protein
MELKKKVRRHIEELTRLAYERGYRDGAQSALAEIEKIAGEDLAKQLKDAPASLEAPAETTAPDVRRRAALKRQQVQQEDTLRLFLGAPAAPSPEGSPTPARSAVCPSVPDTRAGWAGMG